MKMKNIFSRVLLLLSAVLLLTGCSKESYFPEPEESGQLSIQKLVPELKNDEIIRASVNIDDFYIRITRAGETVRESLFKEMPEIIDLTPGDYTISVASAAQPEVAAWEAPYYEGSQDFTIVANQIEEVKTIVCKLANVKVSIFYSDKLKAAMGPDCSVNVVVGDRGSLDFAPTETRSGFFAYVPGSSTLVATFRGTVDGVYDENSRPYVDVVPGSHYKITYTLHGPNVDVPDITGDIYPGVAVDAIVQRVDMTVNVEPGDDPIPDDPGRPGEDPDDPNPPTPGKDAPELTPADLFSSPMTVDGSSVVKFSATSSADGGFTEFFVDINSDVLTKDELGGVGLTDHLDLVSPGQYETQLTNLGFPVNVRGSKKADFDLSQFMGLLAALGPGNHKFVIHVADANGTTEKTLTLITQ